MVQNPNLITIDVIEKEFASDPLYNLLKRKNKLKLIFDNEYITKLEKLTWYTTTSVAPMCNTTVSKVQYYLRNFLEYLEIEESPSTGNAFKIDYKGVIRLKMIIILKDEYRIKGLKQELGYENIVKSAKPMRQNNELWIEHNRDHLEYLISFLNDSGFVLIDEDSKVVEINPYIINSLRAIPYAVELLKENSPMDYAITAAKDKRKSLEQNIEDKEFMKQLLIRTNGLEFREKSKANLDNKGLFSFFKKKSPDENIDKYDVNEDPQIKMIDEKIEVVKSEISNVDAEILTLERNRSELLVKIKALVDMTTKNQSNIDMLGDVKHESKENEGK